MIPRQRKGRQLFFDIEKIQILGLGILSPYSSSLIDTSDPDNDVTVCLLLIKINFHLLIMVEYFTVFSPYRFPRFFKFGIFNLRNFEPIFERISIRSDFDSLFLKFISDQIQTETTGRNNFTVLIKNAVVGNTVFYLKNSSDILIGRSYFLGIRQESDPAKNHENKKQPFHMYDLIYPIPE